MRVVNRGTTTVAGVGAGTQGLFPDGAYTMQLAGLTLRTDPLNTTVGSVAGPKAKIINASVIAPTSSGTPQWSQVAGIGVTVDVEVGHIDNDGYMTVYFSSY